MTMPNTNRKLLVASEKLFISNNILNQFSKDHDVLLFSYDNKKTLEENSRATWRDITTLIGLSYDQVIFMGVGQECNLSYHLYEKRNLFFDAVVFINYEPENPGELNEFIKEKMVLDKSKIYTLSNKKKLNMISDNHEQLPWYSTIRSKRLAQAIYSFVVYDSYSQDGLDGTNTRIIK